MAQIALPLRAGGSPGPSRIVIGSANEQVLEALANPSAWPFGTALLSGAPRSGRSLLGQWFAGQPHGGEVIDDAQAWHETELFHRWNRAQEQGRPLLLITGEGAWHIALPDLRSRLGASLHLAMGEPDDAMIAALIASHAQQRGLVLGEGATTYLVPRTRRSMAAIETLVEMIDRLSLERKAPATMAIWRDALEAVFGAEQGRLL